MTSGVLFQLRRLMGRIWVKLTLYAALSVLTAFVAVAFRPFIPADVLVQLESSALETVLTIVASSMLTVSTFSLGIMANAISGAADSATPRATEVLLEDRTSQNVVATFLGAFIFSLFSVIGLQVGIYEDGGRLVLMGVTIAVIVLIFVAFIRWIELLRTFGRVPDTLARVERVVESTLHRRLENPYLGCHRLDPAKPEQAHLASVCASGIGYVQHVDVERLQCIAEDRDLRMIVNRTPGRFVCATRPIVLLCGHPEAAEPELDRQIEACFAIGPQRTFSQDPQFGMIVLAEIASRALSPAVNDPGTAIDVLRRALRILAGWQARTDPEVMYDRIYMPGLDPRDFLRDLVRPIARDGAAHVEVQHVLQSVLRDLSRTLPDTFSVAAFEQSREALERGLDALALDAEKAEITALADEVPMPRRSASQGRI